MFDNVGEKLKITAMVWFIISVILAFITGMIVIFSVKKILLGLLLGILTIVIMFLSSLINAWLLYAFGELVEKTSATEANTRNISVTLDTLLNSADKFGNTNTDKASAENTTPKASEIHSWACPECGKLISEYPCKYCGYKD